MLELLLLINSFRIQPLQLDSGLSVIATTRAEEIYNMEIKTHGYWYRQFNGTGCSYIGENIAWGFKTDEKAVDAWADSPTHYDNIVNQHYNLTGLGKYRDTIVELFCYR